MFSSLRDPSLSDEEAEKSVHKRTENLMKRKQIGTEAWIKNKSSIAAKGEENNA